MIRAAVLLALLQLTFCLNLPEDWTRCHRNDPQMNSCLQKSVQDVLPKIGTTGVPSLGVKPLEPLDIEKLEVQQSAKGAPVSLKITFTDVHLHGLIDTTVTKFDGHLDKYVLDGETLTPSLLLEADYVMQGKILVFPVTGRGRCNLTMVGLKSLHDIRGKRAERDGQVFMELEQYNLVLAPKKMHTHFHNLFNGDKALGETINKVINENWHLIFTELKPSLEKDLAIVFKDFCKALFHNVPFDDIFLP